MLEGVRAASVPGATVHPSARVESIEELLEDAAAAMSAAQRLSRIAPSGLTPHPA
jgi:hypothetical protein